MKKQQEEDHKAGETQVVKNEDGVVEVRLLGDEYDARRDGKWIAPFLACGDLGPLMLMLLTICLRIMSVLTPCNRQLRRHINELLR